MTTQTLNNATVEIVVILADGKTDPAATLDAREATTVAATAAARRCRIPGGLSPGGIGTGGLHARGGRKA